jgi:hypothetical protein
MRKNKGVATRGGVARLLRADAGGLQIHRERRSLGDSEQAVYRRDHQRAPGAGS